MVATRTSLPAAASPPSEEEAQPDKRRVKNALKKLQIDGTAALAGEPRATATAEEEADEQQTYHYRGAVYAVTAATKEEWLAGQPPRWRKRKHDDDDGSGRRSMPDVGRRPVKRQRQSKRRRRTEGDVVAEEEGEEEEEDTALQHDFTTVGGHEPESCIESARRLAASKGYQVTPLPPNALRDNKVGLAAAIAADVRALARLNERVAVLTPMYRAVAERKREFDERKKRAEQQEVEDDGGGSSDVEIITRHDSFASLTPPTKKKKTDDLTKNNLTADETTSNLPDKNKAGQRLRWSLPGTLTAADRAEAQIHRGRLEGESKSARRRRVRREMGVLGGWGVA